MAPQENTPRIYIANPYGFTAFGHLAIREIRNALPATWEIIDPFEQGSPLEEKIVELAQRNHISLRDMKSELHPVNNLIGSNNEKLISDVDAVLAIIDGEPPDVGVCAEIGFAFARGKPIVALRTDTRVCGDNVASVINLQVVYFIEASGGGIVFSLEQAAEMLQKVTKHN